MSHSLTRYTSRGSTEELAYLKYLLHRIEWTERERQKRWRAFAPSICFTFCFRPGWDWDQVPREHHSKDSSESFAHKDNLGVKVSRFIWQRHQWHKRVGIWSPGGVGLEEAKLSLRLGWVCNGMEVVGWACAVQAGGWNHLGQDKAQQRWSSYKKLCEDSYSLICTWN